MKKILKLLSICFLTIVVFLPGYTTNASTNDDLKVKIFKKNENSISITWNDIGAEYYVLWNDKELLYKGDKTVFSESNLESATYIQYFLFAYDENDEVLSTYELSTYTTFPDKTMINYSLGKNKTAVFLDWSDVPNAIKYDIYLDGVLIAETRYSHFTHNLDEKKQGVYRVLIYLPNTDELPEKDAVLEMQNKSAHLNIPETEDIVEGGKKLSLKYEYDFISLFFNANVLEDKSGIHISQIDEKLKSNSYTASTDSSTTVRIRTFIADACYEDWIPGSGKGDNRGASATSGTHRTQIDVKINFGSSKTITYSQNAGETVAYLFNGCDSTVVSRGTPDIDEDITYFHYGSFAEINVRHSVGSPAFGGVLPNIDYDFDITVYQGGITTISGEHDGFPDYEVYRSLSTYVWDRLYHWDASAEGQSIYSLADPMEIEI